MAQTLSESFDTIQTNFPLWKRQRHQILDCLIKTGFPDYDVFELPANVIRSYERKNIMDVKQSEQEAVLFDNFMILCRWGKNTPYIQCFQGDGNKIIWHWGNVDQTFEKHNQNVCRWMKNCLQLATSLFDIQLILSRLRNDKTRGPTVATFCSLVLRYLRKNVLNELDKLQIEMERTGAKNLLTLQRLCGDMNVQILKPIKRIAREIEEDNIIGGELVNFLFLKKKNSENYHIVNLMDDIISMAIERYYEVIIEWITECTLSYDLAHEFFIWDLRKQKVVERMEFGCINEINAIELNEQQMGTISFDRAFVRVPQLLPEDFKSVSEEIYRLGKYLYIIRQQKGDLDSQCTLDAASFKNLSLGQFCKQINILYQERSQQILEHFKRHYNIVNFAKQLPCFFIGLNSPWIYEFAELFEENELFQVEFEVLDRKMTGLVQKAFQSAQMQENPYNRYFQLKLSEFAKKEGQLAFLPKAGTYPILELHIARGDAALRQAFPAKILEPYRKMFFHLFLLNRAKYLLHRKYFLRNVVSHELARQECATLFLFIRFLNVYQEYICGIAANAYGEFLRKLDSATNLDELVNGQLEFVHKMMEHAKLDQENEELCQWIEALCNEFSLYADGHLNFIELNQKASPIVGKIKKHLLEHRRSLSTLKNLLFGCYFSAIGASANDEPLWKLLQHVDKMPE